MKLLRAILKASALVVFWLCAEILHSDELSLAWARILWIVVCKIIFHQHKFALKPISNHKERMKFALTCLFFLAGTATAAPQLVSQDAIILPPGSKAIESPDGVIQKEMSRIVGGSVSSDGAYPWFGRTDVDIYDLFGFLVSSGTCGSSLLHPRVAISAFHCLDAILDPNYQFDITIYFGANNFDGSDSLSTRKVETAYFFRENYDFPLYDIVLYVLDAPVTNIDPIAFNRACDLPVIGSMAKAIGFGLTSDGGSLSNALMEVELEVQPASVCNDFYSGDDLSEAELVCVFTQGKGTCQGDSGGPIVGTVDGVLTTFGVTSFGGTCAESPSGFIATSHYETNLIKEVSLILTYWVFCSLKLLPHR